MKICPVCREENGSMYDTCINCGTDISRVNDHLAKPIEIRDINNINRERQTNENQNRNQRQYENEVDAPAKRNFLSIFTLCAGVIAGLASFFIAIMFEWNMLFAVLSFVSLILGVIFLAYPNILKSAAETLKGRVIIRISGIILLGIAALLYILSVNYT